MTCGLTSATTLDYAASNECVTAEGKEGWAEIAALRAEPEAVRGVTSDRRCSRESVVPAFD